MTSKPIYIVDEVGIIVTKVNTVVLPKLQLVNAAFQSINYQYGHPLEIVSTLTEWTKSPTYEFKKYPLIALFQDFPEVNDAMPGFDSTVTLHMIIANQTVNTYKASERYDNNFKPILYPVYQELFRQIHFSPVFLTKSADIPHTKFDRLYWGKNGLFGNTDNVFNDFIDVIEITNLKLKVNLNFCNK